MKNILIKWMAVMAVTGWGGMAHADVLFSENFNGLPLLDSVEEFLPGQNVWTNVPPAGWVDNDTGVPGIGEPPNNNGVFEWAGWNFADRDWWSNTAGDQRRSEFTNASGTIMVADTDEWDDAPHPAGAYGTFIATPAISLAGIQADSVALTFDSSWRDFGNQTASLSVSYDGGALIELLRWESDVNSLNFHDDAPNEFVSLDLNNPAGANEVTVTFGLFDAGNDYWWAVDNIEIAGVSEVPIPAAAWLFGSALLSLGVVKRRKA